VVDVNAEAAHAPARTLGGVAIRCDVADSDAATAAIAEAARAHGPARILINCAGVGPAKRIVGREGPMPLAEFERVIRVNLIGTFNMMRLVAAEASKLDPLASGERGIIVTVPSVAAF
jgi:NAD(P)-dependent dehydrogenase (short-subunit alcohol dehydrogenase family)